MAGKREIDIAEETRIDKFYREGCCKKNCYLNFTKEKAAEFRNDIFELDENERDMMIMGFFFNQKHESGNNLEYCIRGFRVCRTAFLFLFAISKKLFSTLSKHFDENGPVPRIHGNSKRLPHNVIDIEHIERARNFIENYALANAKPLPGRVPNYRDKDAKLLLIPSHETKEGVYKQYRELCIEFDFDHMGLSTFTNLWRSQLPNILITKPMGDLCWVCQQGNERLLRNHLESDGEDDEHEKAQDEQTLHIVQATEEARYYRAQVITRGKSLEKNVQYFFDSHLTFSNFRFDFFPITPTVLGRPKLST